MNKPELLKKIKDLQGLSNDEKAILINLVNTNKKYGLVWEDKPEDVEEELLTKLPVLIEVKEKFIEAKPEKSKQELFKDKQGPVKAPNHILIEGDNLHALTALTFSHEGKIDVIYIDPPYNTGNKSWRYNNDYVEKDDSYLHSKWLSFMEKRLKIAKKLLKKTGVLICTIDDNEHATLGLLLRELFPASEIVGVVIIHNPAGVQGKNFSYTHEIAYFVYPNEGKFIGTTEREKDLVSPLRDWGGTSARKLAKTCFYPIIVKGDKIIGFGEVCKEDFHPKEANIKQEDGSTYIYPIDKNGIERKWVYSKVSAEKNIEQLSVKELKGELVIIRKKNLFNYRTVWDDKRYYANVYGSKLLNGIISTDFPFPKSLYAVMDCIKAVIHDKDTAIILDFFAGSGTTGHAVLELNKEDEGNRQFILVTNNENNICEEVTYQRNKSVIKGYTKPNGEKVEGLTNNNLRFYKTYFVGRDKTTANKKELTQLATELLCIKEDIYNEVKAPKNIRLFQIGTVNLMVIYDDNAIPKAVDIISEFPKKSLTKVYVFSEGQDPYTEDFSEVADKVSLCALPDAIYKAYQFVLPKKSRKGIPHIEEVVPAATNESGQLIFETQN